MGYQFLIDHSHCRPWGFLPVLTLTEERIQEQAILCCNREKLIFELHQLCQLLQILSLARGSDMALSCLFHSEAVYFGTGMPDLHLLAILCCNAPSRSCSKLCLKRFRHRDLGNILLVHFCSHDVHTPQDLLPGAGNKPTPAGQLELDPLQEIPPPL